MKHSMLFLFLLTACGGPSTVETEKPLPQPSPGPNPNPGPGAKPNFSEVQSIMQKYCIECHASAAFTKNEQALVASSSKSRVQNSTMPPPYATQLPAADKARFLNFF